MRHLNKTILAGGVVYPAGTAEDNIRVTVADRHFDDGAETDDDLDTPHPVTAELKEACEYLIERHLADKEVPVGHLLLDALSIFGDPDAGSADVNEPAPAASETDAQVQAATAADIAQAADTTPGPAPVVRITGDYDDHKVAALNAEIELRNEGRDAPDRILPTGKNKPDLVAALTADDEN